MYKCPEGHGSGEDEEKPDEGAIADLQTHYWRKEQLGRSNFSVGV